MTITVSDLEFRAWDRTETKFVNGGIIFNNDSMRLESNKPLLLMLYSTKRDKEGTKIFDGDILATSNDDPEHDIWDENTYGTALATIGIMDGFKMVDKHGMGWDWYNDFTVYGLQFLRVIGNIHENPELWKD
jgi:uncharacterized phage protein (TIGR01671 family)